MGLSDANEYTLGRGKLTFEADGTNGFLDLGNAPELNISLDIETLEHYSSQSGLKVKDAEIVMQQDVTASFVLDRPNVDNLRMFFMSTAITDVVQSSGSLVNEAITARLDKWVEIGYRSLSSVVVASDGDSITYTLATDYELDVTAGLIRALSTGAITEGESLNIDASYAALTSKRIDAAGSTTIKGKLHFYGAPANGEILELKGYCSLLPTGEFPLIGDDWLTLPFEATYLTHASYNGLVDVYRTGQTSA